MLTVYRLLLYLYPPAHRCEFSEEMLAVLSEAQTEAWKKTSSCAAGSALTRSKAS